MRKRKIGPKVGVVKANEIAQGRYLKSLRQLKSMNDWDSTTMISYNNSNSTYWGGGYAATSTTSTMLYKYDRINTYYDQNWERYNGSDSDWIHSAKAATVLVDRTGRRVLVPSGSIASRTRGGESHYEVFLDGELDVTPEGVITLKGLRDAHDVRRVMHSYGNTQVVVNDDFGGQYTFPGGSWVTIEHDIDRGTPRAAKINVQLPEGQSASGVAARIPPKKEFNPFINASDMLEEFIAFLGTQDVRQSEVMDLPIELFIKWLVIRACEADQVDIPEDVALAVPASWVARRPQPRCKFCQQFMKKTVINDYHDDCKTRAATKELTSAINTSIAAFAQNAPAITLATQSTQALAANIVAQVQKDRNKFAFVGV